MTAPEPLARITDAVRQPGLAVVRLDDLAAVLELLRRLAEERDTLRAMMRRG